MNTILRILRYGIQGFRRNIWLSVIAVITMTLTITTITTFALGNVVAVKKYKEFNNRIDYNIFIQDSASDADVEQLKQQVAHRPEVDKWVYLSKDEVRQEFEKTFSKNEDLKGVFTPDDNPLPREIDVKFKDPKQIDSFDHFLQDPRFKQVTLSTTYQNNKNLIDNYLHITNFLRIFGLTFTTFFILIAILVILNTIRLAIYARRDEIEIMRLVGATGGYIRGPFLVEGIFFGLMGALISSLISGIFLRQLQGLLRASFNDQTTNFISDLFGSTLGTITNNPDFNSVYTQIFCLQLVIGLLLGITCSALAVRRYLREN